MIFSSALYDYSTVFTLNSLYIPRLAIGQNENDLERGSVEHRLNSV